MSKNFIPVKDYKIAQHSKYTCSVGGKFNRLGFLDWNSDWNSRTLAALGTMGVQ